MDSSETQSFKRVGLSFILMILGAAIALPLVLGFICAAAMGQLTGPMILGAALMFGIIIWIIMLMMVAWGSFTSMFIRRTAKKLDQLPYQFRSSFTSRGGILYIDTENGMIAFISAYNPFVIQVFDASRLDRIETIASSMTGIRFRFYVDGKKISMPTLLTNRVVSTKTGIGAEAVSKADAYVERLKAAKTRAEERKRGT